MKTDPFREYLIQAEPGRREKGYAWNTAIGLQAVDGLKPSQYLVDTAVQNIEGKITIEEAQYLVDSYYEERREKPKSGDRTEEADKVSARIAALLSDSHAGKIRDYNITKKEWVLDGASVLYGSASELRETLEYDFTQEKKYSYKGLSIEEMIHHLAVFVANLWQIHVFGEGNTRTTAVFFIKNTIKI